ncbi:hypothetical protein KXD40_006704 [Peronospora effusa]|nr:hypothetical protein KXD40_006704 [Peronospora effusa]
MKLSALLLLVIAAALAHGFELDTKGNHLRQLEEQPNDPPQPEQTDYPDDDGDDMNGDEMDVDVSRGPGTGLVAAMGEDASLDHGTGPVAVMVEVDASLARGIGHAAATNK